MAAYQLTHYGNPTNLAYRMYDENYHGEPKDRPVSWRQVTAGSRGRIAKSYNQLARLVGDSDEAIFRNLNRPRATPSRPTGADAPAYAYVGTDADGLATYRA